MAERPEDGAGVADVDLTGSVALVTGSTRGIGRETALALGRLGADVIVHGRDRDRGQRTVADLQDVGAEAEFVPADFADPDEVRGLADAVREEVDQLDILVNNAGGYFRKARLTDLGVEYTFAVNHLAPYLLTTELLSTLASGSRVVTVASEAHRGGPLDFEAFRSIDEYSAWSAYQQSKLANILFTVELARRFEATGVEITANAAHPGAVPGTGFFRDLPVPLPRLGKLAGRLPLVNSVSQGAETPTYLAAAPDIDHVSGAYFADCARKTPSRAGRDSRAARRLWTVSANLLGIEEPLPRPEDDGSVGAGNSETAVTGPSHAED